ncbi:NACHT domain-containing protein [Actinomadura syzygii]|uniref:NACHT domain-containing protein n=1 Tax=Actinomadura syzygii TaxID=1427538 RepID=A0A5D0U7M2_9ACTN|nr:NACHT domain-containing protein [Actinomadura syzygii]TYC14338.1 NACHT domain-containing protein [Actinomadura syzygii]
MRRAQAIALGVAAAAAVVVGGVATNQVLDDGRLSWNWAYLAFGFTVLASVFTVHASQSAGSDATAPLGGKRSVYLRQLRASVLDMETIGIVTQSEFVLRMRQVYVQLSLRHRPVQGGSNPGVGLTAQELAVERPLRSFLNGQSRVLAVIGASGSGKTTLARYTALAMCSWQGLSWRRGQLPVLLYLRDHVNMILDEVPPGLAKVATSVGWLDGKISAGWLEKRLDKGRCLVLLDGLDEIADERDRRRTVVWIRRQIERFPAVTFVITSRPHGYLPSPIPNADVLQIQRFDSEQISEFLHHWYYATECRARGRSGKEVSAMASRQADDLLEKLRSTPAVYELAANPLLLTMIANVHRYRSALPRSRAALYAEMCDVLIHRRQEAKYLTDATGLDGPKKERVIRHLALHMMRRQARDISIADAQEAIRHPLRQVTGGTDLTPELFLSEVRKSGLLMGEHGTYGFAHLTLQEYLASAHIRHQPSRHLQFLTEGVDDPWWRETTLLWAAASDATPVIDACLASGTLHALTLAFDCAEEALEVSHGARARLNDLLTTSPETHRGERQKIIAAVIASRNLREVVWLGTTAVSAQPVSQDLYNLFALQERAIGRHTPPLNNATSLLADDAMRFVSWLNTLFEDGTAYRLPTSAELAHPEGPLLSAMSRYTVWTTSNGHPALYRPPGVAWPYTPSRNQLAVFPAAIIEHIRPLLYLGRIASTRPEPRYLLAHMRVQACDDPHQEETSAAQSRAYDLTRTLDLAIMLAADLKAASPEYLGMGLSMAIAMAHALALDLACFTREIDFDNDGSFIRELSRPDTLHLAHKRIRDLGTRLSAPRGSEIRRDIARQYAASYGRGHEGVWVMSEALEIGSHGARDLAPTPLFARNDALVGAVEYARAIAPRLAYTKPHADDISRTKTLRRAAVMSSDIARALTRDVARDVARRITTDLGTRYREILTATLMACKGLLRWESFPQYAEIWEREGFERFLAETLEISVPYMSHATDDPAHTLSQAMLWLRPELKAYVNHAQDLLVPVLNRTAPASPGVLAIAGAALMAAIAHLGTSDEQIEALPRLSSVLGTVITLYTRESGAPTNEALLLVRN